MLSFHFVGFSYSVESCKSVVLSAAMTEGHLAPEQAAELALLEQRFQVCQECASYETHVLSCAVLSHVDRKMGPSAVGT